MATPSESPAPTPQTFTYTVFLEPDKDPTKPLHVRIRDTEKNFFLNVKKGDKVQFVLDPADPKLKGARLLVAFAPVNPPFEVGRIQSTTLLHEVTNEGHDWMAECYITTADGAKYGYEGDGKRPCPEGC